MGAMASQITSLTIVCSTVYKDADHRKHQSSASLAFVRGIHRGPVNSPHKWPITRKMFSFDDVIMIYDQIPVVIYLWLSCIVTEKHREGRKCLYCLSEYTIVICLPYDISKGCAFLHARLQSLIYLKSTMLKCFFISRSVFSKIVLI